MELNVVIDDKVEHDLHQ